jgi:aspartyl-tRNA(Asn)/glutamyl-tRNA(Gln) amidotransferase subunit C
MSRVDRDTVRHVARLARLDLSEQEIEQFCHDLGDILEYVAKLNELDTSNVEPTSHSLRLVNVLREDCVRPSLSQEEALANAPETEEGCFKVPPVIQEM